MPLLGLGGTIRLLQFDVHGNEIVDENSTM